MKILLKLRSGASVWSIIDLTRIKAQNMDKYLADKEERDGWCTHGGAFVCAKFGARKCCPPEEPMFKDLKPKSYVYVFAVTLLRESIMDSYPKLEKHNYLARENGYRIGAYIASNIMSKLTEPGEVGFKVGGCLGCKPGACKRFFPALEGVGVKVQEMVKDLFNIDLSWGIDAPKVTCVSAVYTDREIPKSVVLKVIEEVANGNKKAE